MRLHKATISMTTRVPRVATVSYRMTWLELLKCHRELVRFASQQCMPWKKYRHVHNCKWLPEECVFPGSCFFLVLAWGPQRLRCCLFILRNAGCIPQSSDAAFWSCALHAKILDGFISVQVHRINIVIRPSLPVLSSLAFFMEAPPNIWIVQETEVAAVVPFLLYSFQSLHIDNKP